VIKNLGRELTARVGQVRDERSLQPKGGAPRRFPKGGAPRRLRKGYASRRLMTAKVTAISTAASATKMPASMN
jgi:hypothetical protein